MSASPDESAIVAAILSILGDNPKSSLLFGAPAIALRQIETYLDVPPSSLDVQAALPAAAQAAQKVFGGFKHAQLKRLMRVGKEEEWIVFRPSLALPTRSDGSTSDTQARLERPAKFVDRAQHKVLRGTSTDDLGTPNIEGGASLSPKITTLPESEIGMKRKLLRPFLRTVPSLGDTKPQSYIPAQQVPLPPAHRIGSGDFGAGLLLPLATAASARPWDGPSHIHQRTPGGSDLETAARTFRSAKIRARGDSGLPATAPLNDWKDTSLKSHKPGMHPGNEQHQRYIPVTLDPVGTDKDLAPSSLPYLSETCSILDITERAHQAAFAPASTSHQLTYTEEAQRRRRQEERDESIKDIERSVEALQPRPQRLDPIPSPGPHALDFPANTQAAPITVEPSSSASTTSASSISSSSLLTPSFFSDLATPTSPVPSSIPPTPWLNIAFKDLPFGPDVPAVSPLLYLPSPQWPEDLRSVRTRLKHLKFHVIGWAKDRWRILCAEMVVVFGAVYIIQVMGV